MPDADILVVDDNSPDGTGRLVRNHPQFMDSVRLTSRLSDNIAANVIGLALGTALRHWSYKRFVFAVDSQREPEPVRV